MNGIPVFRRPLLPLVALLLCVAPRAFAQEARLINLSTRAPTGAGANILTAGFVVGPGEPRQVLIRAVGPTLAAFGVTGSIANPVLTVFDADGKAVAANDDWSNPAAGQAALVATFAQVGAFPLAAGGRDSALVTTLQPGSYTAQVANATGVTGETLVEVYQIGESGAKLVNLSTRLQVTATSSPIIGFVVAPGAGTRRLLIRNAGPALGAFGLTGTLPDPTLRLTDATGRLLASNDNWSVPANPEAADAGLLAAAFGVAGAFAFPAASNDAAVLIDLGPGNYGIQVGSNSGSGLAIVEVYDLTPVDPPTITIVASRATADESGLRPGEFTFTRTGGNLSPLTVRYSVGGSAVNGTDYGRLSGTVSFPAGVTTASLPVLPNPDVQNEGSDSVVVTVAPGPNYLIGTNRTATVTIGDSPATLFIATVRPTTAATGGSTGYGTATILLSSSGTLAAVNLNFANLSSAQTTAHLTLGATEDYVIALPIGQVSGALWTFAPVAPYSTAQLQAALRNGQIAVRIDSAKYPDGELKGSFIAGAGSRVFAAPAAAPAAKLTGLTANEAARFLTQTTFGPTREEIDALTGGSINAWLNAQMALPFTSHRTAIQDDRRTFGGSGSFTNWNATHPPNRQSAWWKLALSAPDQLRQRVAFALSQILVVSDVALGDDSRAEPLAAYYDILGQGAFGNFRNLLERVTLNPMMAEYLSSLRNAKATFDSSGAMLTTPDENYAREIMQLFSIGLVRLQPDGTLLLGDDGLPIPTYNQTTITELAKVFTGWAYPSTNANAFRTAGANHYSPLQLFPAFHDDGPKNLSPVLAAPIPAGQGGATDLQLALDALFQHPNTAPFISKLLIQRLVTSNPSPAYVYRVAQRFIDDGTGTRGNLGAVVRAILTDHEARSSEVAANPSFGKLKEPILRLSGLLRGLKASSSSGRYVGFRVTVDGQPITSATPRPATAAQINMAPNAYSGTRLDGVQGNLAQAALRSPTVFNFYHADYVQPGPLAAAGLVVPEFEITDDNFAINVPNFLRTFVNATLPTTNGVPTPAAPYTLTLDLNHELTLVSDPAALVAHFNLLFAAGSVPADAQSRIRAALSALPASATALDRVRTALLLTLTSPAAAIQK
ncbi:MAG: DUF1800 family protein [Opitutaceae bacterium]